MTRRYRAHGFATAIALSVVATMLATTSSAGTARPYFSTARNLWLSEAEMVSSAVQNVPLVDAVHELQRGLSVHGGDTAGYRAAIKTIEGFERIPITSETRAQMTASHRDVSALNEFFDLTAHDVAVLTDTVPTGRYYDAARSAFEEEPTGIRRGVKVEALETVVADLKRASTAQSSRSILYASALVDARSLEGATGNDVATSDRSLLNRYNQDIYYLDVFFRTDRLEVSTAPQ